MRSRRVAVRNQKIAFASVALLIILVIFGSVLFGSIKAQAAPAEPSFKYYTSVQVQKGDTLWNIAQNYLSDEYSDIQEYIDEICSINHISEESIHAGQYLTVPYYSADYLE